VVSKIGLLSKLTQSGINNLQKMPRDNTYLKNNFDNRSGGSSQNESSGRYFTSKHGSSSMGTRKATHPESGGNIDALTVAMGGVAKLSAENLAQHFERSIVEITVVTGHKVHEKSLEGDDEEGHENKGDDKTESSIPSGEKPTPFIKYDTVKGEWDYYIIKNGKFMESGWHGTVPSELYKPGEKDAPDTVIKTTVIRPPIPKKSIKRKPL
jgi:hypothetical protein